jgi:hypothetical protein
MHPAMYMGLLERGSVILDVKGGRLDATFLDRYGAIRDYLTLSKEADTTGVDDVNDPCPATPIGSPVDSAGCSAPQLDTGDDGGGGAAVGARSGGPAASIRCLRCWCSSPAWA